MAPSATTQPLVHASGSNQPTKDVSQFHSSSTENAFAAEAQYAAHNYHPLPIVFAKASGCSVWDPEGNHYLDFLSAYSAVNQGHCHPELVKTLTEQASRLTLSSRAFYNDVFPKFAEFVTKFFGYEMVLPMNTGAEAVETVVKIARKWGYKSKKIEAGQAIVFSVENNFHGRTFAAITMSTDPESRENYGPYIPNLGCINPKTGKPIRFGNVDDVREAFEAHGKDIAGFLVEPIQGEAGIVVPDDSYLREIRKLCDKHNVLMICDEIQTGIARTGKLLCCEWSGVKPDLVLLGKAISGGMYPVSCVLGSKEVMLTVEPGTHGSTYGGNPLGSAIAIRALQLVKEERLVERAQELGEKFRQGLAAMNSPLITTIRGKGLLNAIVIDESKANGHTAWDLCMLFKEKGLLAKPTHQNIIRLAPPLVITEEEIATTLDIIRAALIELPKTPANNHADGH
ncbi:ornithine aminotransferase [Eremomyces bilateralis CBS 781.70]|uniref:Ornithine aminotransferase n=1 Tax=Eremomyces bilateralis CBS 781.70 TaxID=1392243 RepID=A0A6G1GD80_9PEZI|nr:ornithine aminotransferase [Eremomyces bilateralis CBS 781.70]KAF1815866.1 ornithine aminotransferase [Eremomyces bilateralis CBS 781.70]